MAGAAVINTATQFSPEIAREVEAGLLRDGQKTLPASMLYDPVGSALFEAITVLPEYGLTRADARLLARHAHSIVHQAGEPELVVELGSGSGLKTRPILEAIAADRRVVYRPIDISSAALDGCRNALDGARGIVTEPIESSYEDGLRIALSKRDANTRAIVLFLGSTIGNFSRAEARIFLRNIRQELRPGDTLLLGADLLKERQALLLAYDDPAGVTAAFNKNLLARINRELGADFDLRKFAHESRFDSRYSRVEMHLRSECKQSVRIEGLGVSISFDAGETIWTESSHKFGANEISALGEVSGWRFLRQWVDREWGFAETLFAA